VATDRRNAIRFEIVGRLRGSLAAEPPVRLRDLGRGGALIEAPWSLVPNTVHNVRIDSDQHLLAIDARVSHVRRSYAGNSYLIGLEFLHVDDAASTQIERLVARAPGSHAQPS
jgi:hypothetical protein